MGILKKYYVVYCFTILFLSLSAVSFAQKVGSKQKGLASWYGSKYHGRKTSSGEVYNKRQLTAAHPSLPFGTKVKVTHVANNQSVVLRINDRGPFKGNRIIDVSEAAAEKIGLIRQGTGQVIVEILELGAGSGLSMDTGDFYDGLSDEDIPDATATASEQPLQPYYVIQAGVFSDPDNAILRTEAIRDLDGKLALELTEERLGDKRVLRVMAGQFTDRQAAERYLKLLNRKGIEGLVRQMPGRKS